MLFAANHSKESFSWKDVSFLFLSLLFIIAIQLFTYTTPYSEKSHLFFALLCCDVNTSGNEGLYILFYGLRRARLKTQGRLESEHEFIS